MTALAAQAFCEHIVSALAPSAQPKRILLDCTELLDVVTRFQTVTGIDRVQIRILNYIVTMADDWERSNYCLVARLPGGRLGLIGHPAAHRLMEAISQPRWEAFEVAERVGECLADMRDAAPTSDDLYFITGSFWTASTYDRHLSLLKDRGVALGIYLYDLIPITHPQYCMSAHCRAFSAAFAEVVPLVDFVLTISDFVARDLERLMAAQDMPAIPIISAPLAHELEFVPETGGPATSSDGVVHQIGFRPFVLCVGTIEIRKNHLYLVNIWQTLLREGVDMPTLVFVGRLGWRVEALTEQLQSLRYLNGRVQIISDVSDADLTRLYETCLFTVFPSFVEGWGLPVGESLARGKIVVASTAASIPEVGGPHALYVDPHNLHTGVDVVRRLLTDKDFFRATEESVRRSFKPRTWAAAGEHFLSALIQGYQARLPTRHYAPILPSGSSLLLSNLIDTSLDLDAYLRDPLRLVLHSGWRPIDHGGAWIKDRTAILRFDAQCPGGTLINVAMTFVTVPWLHDSALIIRGESEAPVVDQRHRCRRVLAPSCMFRHSVKACVGRDGVATLHLEIEGEPHSNPPDEMAALWVRMLTIGWCRAEDLGGRLALLEEAIWS